ncbi:MAG: hypothetical protein WAW86_01615 [Gammaproteobacteria bacterium]
MHYPEPDYFLKSVDGIDRKVKRNQVLVTVVKIENFLELLTSLSDYESRPPLRKPIEPSTVTHKFFHLTEETQPYQKIKKLKSTQHQRTKKTSCTLLPADMNSVLFGEKHESTPLVALLFDQSKCLIKAMLKYDRGTYYREWVNTEEGVSKYRKSLDINNLNFTKMSAFQAHVNQSSSINEVLACLSRDALIGIAIAKDTPEARSLAKIYQDDIKTKLGILLPIIFYNRTQGNIRAFTSHDEVETKTQLNCLKEYISRNQVMSLREKINSKALWYKKTWLSFFVNDFTEDKTPTKTAKQILDLIDRHIRAPNNASWEQLEKTIHRILANEILSQPFYRSEDTQLFYQELSGIRSSR